MRRLLLVGLACALTSCVERKIAESIVNECELGTSYCEPGAEYAHTCTPKSNAAGMHWNAWVDEDCGSRGLICVADGDEVGCAVRDETCDPSTFTPECLGEVPVQCVPIAEGAAYPVARKELACDGEFVAPGTHCFQGKCVVDETPCDPSTFQPYCDGEQPVTCETFDDGTSYPSAHARACDLSTGNSCHVVDGYVGCSSTGEACESSLESRCEGNSRVFCGLNVRGPGADGGHGLIREQRCEAQCTVDETGAHCF